MREKKLVYDENVEVVRDIEPRFLKISGVVDKKHPKNSDGKNNYIYEVINKPDATAMLLFNYDYSEVFLVKQFRAGALKEIWEGPAGVLEEEYTPKENMLKEITEECGFQPEDIIDIEEVAGGYISPGYTTEYMYIFVGRVRKGAATMKEEEIKGDENENITKRGFFKIEEARKMGAFDDIKTSLALRAFMAKPKEKIGVFGGTLNMITSGHMRLLLRVLEEGHFDRIIIEPVSDYYTGKGELLNYIHRNKMVELAIEEAGNNKLELGTYETVTCGYYQPSTIETMNYYREKYPLADIHFICGSDVLKSMSEWGRKEEFFEKFGVYVLARGNENIYSDVVQKDEFLTYCSSKIKAVYEIAENNISSTAVRAAIEKGINIAFLVPATVKKYIEENGLYKKKTEE